MRRTRKRPPLKYLDVVHIDDLPCVLNPVQIADLAVVIERTQADRRPATLMAFLGWDQDTWCRHAGLLKIDLSRWLRRIHRFPYGGAMRLSKVVGQEPEILFKDWA